MHRQFRRDGHVCELTNDLCRLLPGSVFRLSVFNTRHGRELHAVVRLVFTLWWVGVVCGCPYFPPIS